MTLMRRECPLNKGTDSDEERTASDHPDDERKASDHPDEERTASDDENRP